VILVCVIGVLVISVKDPFDVSTAEEFLYCYMASLVWSLLIGELISTLTKAWLVWMAGSYKKEEGESDNGFWTNFALQVLLHVPCMLPTEL
jgi:hypothetical protein